MSFDVSGLSNYVQNNSKEIAVKAVASASTASLLIANKRLIAGVKGREAIRTMDADVQVQDGSACGRSPLGSTTLGEKWLDVKPMKDEQDVCAKSLRNTIFAEFLQKGQAPQEEITNELAQSIMDYRASKIAAEIENILWKSDVTITGTTNYNLIDGITKQVGAGQAITASGADLVKKLQSVFLAMPVVTRTQADFRIFIGEDKFAEYQVALANLNLFKSADDKTIFGTSAKFEVTPGLNGAGKVYAMRISNLVLGIDGEGDQDKAEFRYSLETGKHYMDFHWAIGVKVMESTEVGVASI